MAKSPRSLSGSVVAITGGARGIGRATAAALVREGAKVAIGDVDADAARATAGELGEPVAAFELDVTDRGSFASFLDRAENELGPLDALINNAGIMALGPFLEETDRAAQRMIDINVHGVMLGMKLALPRMVARGRGHIVNIASGAGKSGFPGAATYCASKHAVVGVSEAVASELLKTPIELSVVLPAVVNTELAAGLSRARGVRISEAADVADAIVEALRAPRFDVYVPRSLGPITKLMGVLPRRARLLVARALRADQVLARVDAGKRSPYAERLEATDRRPLAAPAPAGELPAAGAGGDPLAVADAVESGR